MKQVQLSPIGVTTGITTDDNVESERLISVNQQDVEQQCPPVLAAPQLQEICLSAQVSQNSSELPLAP